MPGLPEKAAAQGLSPLDYMRKYGVVEIASDLYRQDERPLDRRGARGRHADEHGVLRKPADDESTPPLVGEAGAVGVQLEDGSPVAGWLYASAQLELYSRPDGVVRMAGARDARLHPSHVAHAELDPAGSRWCWCRRSGCRR